MGRDLLSAGDPDSLAGKPELLAVADPANRPPGVEHGENEVVPGALPWIVLQDRIQETAHLRVYDLGRVELVADWEAPGVQVIAFHGQRRLLVGGSELTIWEI